MDIPLAISDDHFRFTMDCTPLPNDWYNSFESLAAKEVEGVGFRVKVDDRESDVLIMAPHGGYIEPGTSEIASATAGVDFSLYLFEGLRPKRAHHELHITSHKFNEPRSLEIARKSFRLVAMHGRADIKKGKNDKETVWIGGLDDELASNIIKVLTSEGFKASKAVGELAGKDPNNICNRSSGKRGVQLEIPRSLRDRLSCEPQLLTKFADGVRRAILNS